MSKEIRVTIIEDDPYSRDLMAMLLARDWRTRVVAELGSAQEVDKYLSQDQFKADIVILDTEMPGDQEWSFRITAALRSIHDVPAILCTGTQVDLKVLRNFAAGDFEAYLLKSEILYCLGSAVSQILSGETLTTPSIWQASHARDLVFHSDVTVVDGASPVANFTAREKEIIRLGILFNLAHRDVADELIISPIWVSELVSNIYEKLGMREIVSGEYPVSDYFEDTYVADRITDIIERSSDKNKTKKLRKTPWVSTLAFHMLTIPIKNHIHIRPKKSN